MPTSQPSYPATKDTSHPIFTGSTNQILTFGGAGGWVYNSGSGIGAPTVGGTSASTTTPGGSALVFNGTDTYVDYGTTNIPTAVFTFLWGGVFTTVDNFRGLVDCISGANGWTIFQVASDTLYFSVNGYAGATSLSGWTPGTFFHGALRFKSGASNEHAWFRNGTLQSSSTNSMTVGTSISSLRVGWQRGGGYVGLNGPLEYCYLVDTYLNDATIASIAADPYAVFLTGGGGGTPGYGFVKVSGSWKNLSGVYVKVSGVWKSGTFQPNVSGSWKTLA
jgi:hypothetical protein